MKLFWDKQDGEIEVILERVCMRVEGNYIEPVQRQSQARFDTGVKAPSPS